MPILSITPCDVLPRCGMLAADVSLALGGTYNAPCIRTSGAAISPVSKPDKPQIRVITKEGISMAEQDEIEEVEESECYYQIQTCVE